MLDSSLTAKAEGFIDGFTFQRLLYLVNSNLQAALDFNVARCVLEIYSRSKLVSCTDLGFS